MNVLKFENSGVISLETAIGTLLLAMSEDRNETYIGGAHQIVVAKEIRENVVSEELSSATSISITGQHALWLVPETDYDFAMLFKLNEAKLMELRAHLAGIEGGNETMEKIYHLIAVLPATVLSDRVKVFG